METRMWTFGSSHGVSRSQMKEKAATDSGVATASTDRKTSAQSTRKQSMPLVLANGHATMGREAENGLPNGQDSFVQPCLTDFYQITMLYGYWKAGMHLENAVFDVFFRKNPFQGEFTVFAGLEDVLRFVETFKFSKSDIEYLKSTLPDSIDVRFFDYLTEMDCRSLRIRAVPEGTVVFPREPMITIEGPLAVCQIVETSVLNLLNYSSLVATNAARFRQVAGEKIQLLEFGLRRAQGPNGGLAASKYCYMGGFDGTSNVLAGKLFGIPVKGTQAHSFISAFTTVADLKIRNICVGEKDVDLYALSRAKLKMLMDAKGLEWGVGESEISEGELAAFVAYAIAFPTTFLALIDTYDVLRSGVINFLAVTLALFDLGYKSLGCRIDSGDLSYLSKEIRDKFRRVAALDPSFKWVENLTIVASNDINEDTIVSLNEQQHSINAFGVGTHLVTCQKQPALGGVYKLVTVNDKAKIKLSQEVQKITIPGNKCIYRIYGKDHYPIIDLMTLADEPEPKAGEPILARHPFEESKRAKVIPTKVVKLHKVFWEHGEIQQPLPSLQEIRQHVKEEMEVLRKDHKRFLNPTPYKVSVSEKLYEFLHKIWLRNAPVGQLE